MKSGDDPPSLTGADELFDEYVRRRDAGERVDFEEIVRGHPEREAELRARLGDRELLQSFAFRNFWIRFATFAPSDAAPSMYPWKSRDVCSPAKNTFASSAPSAPPNAVYWPTR